MQTDAPSDRVAEGLASAQGRVVVTSRHWPARVLEGVAVGAAAIAVFLGFFQPWGHRFRVPFSYSGDGNFHAMLAKTMVERGWYESTPLLGAPYGQKLYDFPLGGDHAHLFAFKVLTFFTRDPYLVVNAYTAIAFVLVTLIAYAVLRSVGLRMLTAAVLALLYSFLPYHIRHVPHVFLAAYWSVPLGVLLTLWILGDGVPLLRATAHGLAPRRRWVRLGLVTAMVVLIGSASTYYAVFTAMIAVLAAAIESVRRRSRVPIVTAIAVALAIGAVSAANMAPELLYRLHHGQNPVAQHRFVIESEMYALRPAQLVLPAKGYPVGTLSDLGSKTDTTVIISEGGLYLGLVGVAGLVLALALALPGLLGGTRAPPLVGRLAVIILVAFAIGTVDGVGYLVAVLGFTQLRAWNRIDVFIAFASLATVGVLADRWCARRLSGTRARRAAAAGLAVAIGMVGLVDQLSPYSAPAYAATRAEQRSDADFVAHMERALPRNAMVFELPAIAFPESPQQVRMVDYDLLKGYLMGTGALRWSYGSMKGRAAEWYTDWAAQQPLPRMIEGAAAAGFDALYVDRFGYADAGAALAAAVAPLIGPLVYQSVDGRLRWYDLRVLRVQLATRLSPPAMRRLGAAVLTSLGVEWDQGVTALTSGPAGPFRAFVGATARLRVTNGGHAGRRAHLRMLVTGPAGSHLDVSGPGRRQTRVALSPSVVPLALDLTLPAGASTVRFATDAAPGSVELVQPTIADAAVDALLPGSGSAI